VELSVLIVSWNTRELLRQCLSEILKETAGIQAEIFLVDNASADGSAEMVRADFPNVHLIANDTNRGFAAANNQALAKSTGEFILLLNPDTEVKPGAIKTLIDFAKAHPKAGIVAPQLLNSDDTIQRSCREFPTFAGMLFELMGLSRLFPNDKRFGAYKMLDFNHTTEREVDQPEGACLLLPRQVIEKVGSLDEGYFMLFEEVDWCYRIKQAGWQIWFTPAAQVVHHYGQSIKQVKVRMIMCSHRGLYRFWSKHYCGAMWPFKPFVYSGLMALAGYRIARYKLASLLNRNVDPQPGRIANAS
jgi:N-acetylglucosaminyl-diphospho-decaprenol L-rhamnosyltransferase